MQSAPKDLLKEYVRSQQFTNTADIMRAMKEIFRDVLEQVMEVERDNVSTPIRNCKKTANKFCNFMAGERQQN